MFGVCPGHTKLHPFRRAPQNSSGATPAALGWTEISQSRKTVVFIKPQLIGKAMTWTIVIVEIAHVYASEVMINCLKLRVEVIEFMCRHIHW